MLVIHCPHEDQSPAGRVCIHLLECKDADYVKRFSGNKWEYDLVCFPCSRESELVEKALVLICKECFDEIERTRCWEGTLGTPEILTRQSDLRFKHEEIDLPGLAGLRILSIQPITSSADEWLACTSTGTLLKTNPLERTVKLVAQVPHEALDFDGPNLKERTESWIKGPALILRVSPNGELAAVANTYGRKGVVLELATGKVTMHLLRDDYYPDVSAYPLAFIEQDNLQLVIHGTTWNRLDISNPKTGLLLTGREPTSYSEGEEPPEHYLDYFHCQLTVSPGQQFVADNGWVWHPVGVVSTWNVPRWMHENVWESEDGESKRDLCNRTYYWDGPLCWLDNHRLAVWGFGDDDKNLIPAVILFDVRTGQQERWFPGPKGSLVFDEFLFAFDKGEGMTVWDVETGERLLVEAGFCPDSYHPKSEQFVTLRGSGKCMVSQLVIG